MLSHLRWRPSWKRTSISPVSARIMSTALPRTPSITALPLGIAHADHGCCVAFGTLVQLVLEGATQEEFDEVQNFCLEVGLPVTLAEIGVTTKEQIASIAEHACVPGETIHNLAGDVQPIELYDAILQADAMGKRALGQTSC